MASQSEKAQQARALNALRSPAAVGGFRFNPGHQNRKARRAAASTNGLKLAAARKANEALVMAAAAGRPQLHTCEGLIPAEVAEAMRAAVQKQETA